MKKGMFFVSLCFMATLSFGTGATPIYLVGDTNSPPEGERFFDVSAGLTGGCYLWNDSLGSNYIPNLGGVIKLTKPLLGEIQGADYISYFDVGLAAWAAYGSIDNKSAPVFGVGASFGIYKNFINLSIGWSGVIPDRFYNNFTLLLSGGSLNLNSQ